MLKKIYEKLDIENVSKSVFFSFTAIVLIGGTAFFSAALGILNRNEIKFYGMIESQIYAYIIGFLCLSITYFLSYRFLNNISPYVYFTSIILTFLVFIPSIGMAHGGSVRWVEIYGFSLQPAEFIKVSTILMTAWYLKKYDHLIDNFKNAFTGYIIIMLPVSLAMFLQKDLGTLIIIGSIVTVIFFNSRVKLRYVMSFILLGLIVISAYVATNSYVRNRIFDYAGKNGNSKGISYQNDQALIAIGNGGIFGRGLGQSVQKFHYLPEPAGDSVFAVYSEEWGMIGSYVAVLLFAYLCFSLMKKSVNVKNIFVKNVIIGGATLIFFQSLLNIGSMLKIIPLSGDTLPFFSQGGTALISNFILMGILLKFTKKHI